jgi:hypothetical protein
MENLISKWKQTVENHNRKLTQLREDSLGAAGRRSTSLVSGASERKERAAERKSSSQSPREAEKENKPPLLLTRPKRNALN